MQIYLAKTAGFCFGVDRAVSLVEQAIRDGKRAVTLGPIIHNRHVVERFEAMGLREIARAEDAQPGQTVVIRAHGIPVSEQQTLAARGAKLVDATCPFVKKIHVIARQAEEAGLGRQALVIVGRALGANGTASRLYDADFSHGYRNRLVSENFDGRCALYAFTDKGLTRAQEIAAGFRQHEDSLGGQQISAADRRR